MLPVLVLDAMGVIYASGDDVADLLIPFIKEHGGNADLPFVQQAFVQGLAGQIPAREIWDWVGLDASLEDEYLLRHRLSPGLTDFLQGIGGHCRRVMCLSNDIAEWSLKLRNRFGLGRFISAWYISGEMKCQKPSPEIFRRMLDDSGVDPRDVVYVDDRHKNVIQAHEMGMRAVLFRPLEDQPLPDGIARAQTFDTVARVIAGG